MPSPFRLLARQSRCASRLAWIFVPALLALWLALVAQPAQASTIIVTDCSTIGLTAAFEAAGNGDQITFNCGGSHNPATILFNQTRTITRALSIDGGGVITFSGGNSIRLFFVSASGGFSGTLTLANLTVSNGKIGSGQGGAVFVGAGGLLVISNSLFYSNTINSGSSGAGGAIFNGGDASIVNSRFLSNTVIGASSSRGGAIASNGVLTLTGSDLENNRADEGGAFWQASIGSVVISTTSFITNNAIFGGALLLNVNGTLLNNTFVSNRAANLGGALYLTFNATNTQVSNGSFVLNTAATSGSAVQIDPSAGGTFASTVFANNGNPSVPGGAFYNLGNLTLLDVTSGSNLSRYGGTVANGGTLTVVVSNLVANIGILGGGAISNTGRVYVDRTTFSSNTTGGTGIGGAISNHTLSGTLTVVASKFTSNSGSGGGAILVNADSRATILGSTLQANQAITAAGGGILNNGFLTVSNSTLAGNVANFNGGAIFNGGSGAVTTTVINSTILANSAPSGTAGGLRNASGALTIRNTLVISNANFNCQGTVTDGGNNLQFGDATCAGVPVQNPLITGLSFSGIQQFAPLPVGSPAIDAGNNAVCPSTDQIGSARPQDGDFNSVATCDIGAYEYVPLHLFLPAIRR